MSSAAFTLIELLVVVTIIVILLALLAPAMDQALYQAELAECGGRMDSIIVAATQYAGDNKQNYPKRQNNYNWDALMVRFNLAGLDFRPMWAPYLGDGLKAFSDPFIGRLDYSDQANREGTVLYSTLHIYTGLPRGSFAGMDRIGQKFAFEDTKSQPGTPIMRRFSIIAADREHSWKHPDRRWTTAGHPDKDGLLRLAVSQNQNGLGLPAGVWPANADVTVGWWTGADTRGPVDLNYGYADGSVIRVPDMLQFDDRMAKIPDTGQGEYDEGGVGSPDGRYTQVPIEN